MTRNELESLRARLEGAERLAIDPLGFVDRTLAPLRQEVVAFLAAGLAFGNVTAIGRSVRRVVAHLDDLETIGTVAHRWVRGADLQAVVGRLLDLQQEYGSLGALFEVGYVPGDMRRSMTNFSDRLRDGLPATRGVVTLTTRAADGSACKRLNLFMRWVVRSEGVDLGLWRGVSPADLMMPLDVHVIRYARRFGLTRRTTADWKMVEEVTAHFRGLCPEDPLRYDFAISHYGMAEGWD